MTATGTPTATETRKNEATSSIDARPSPTETGDVTTDPSARPVYSGGLPLRPKITPASIIAGIFMTILGFLCCGAGVKVKRLHIFLSTAFLCAAGVTALIVYAMDPPVKSAVFVGYVIAAIATGFTCGGLACIFPEVTENLACLFGGFALSMWILCLKPGGLIEPVYGKVIVITAISIVILALSFHRITKPYVLIFSLSVGGAVVGVLGIDCFSRAGLKEMWIYLWELNEAIFPYETNTYPHTRGIKIELGIVVVAALVGVLSQVKLWAIVETRRNEKEAQRQQRDGEAKITDEETGRRIKMMNEQERKEWEEKHRVLSVEEMAVNDGNGSDIVSDDSTAVGGVEPKIDSCGADKRGEGSIYQLLADRDGPRKIRSQAVKGESSGSTVLRIPSEFKRNSSTSDQSASAVSRRESGQTSNSTAPTSDERPAQTSTPSPYVIPPLPFQLRRALSEGTQKTPNAIGLAMPEPATLRNSATSTSGNVLGLSRRSFIGNDTPASIFDSAQRDDWPLRNNMPVNINGRHSCTGSSSSIGTEKNGLGENSPANTLPPMGVFSRPGSPEVRTSFLDTVDERLSSALSVEPSTLDDTTTIPTVSTTAPDSTELTNSSPPSTGSKNLIRSGTPLLDDILTGPTPKAKHISAALSMKANAEEIKPETQCSHIVKVYRTNEWAKHLSQAEPPEPDDLDRKHDSTELPAPLDIESLQQTGEYQPPPAVRGVSNPKPTFPTSISQDHHTSSLTSGCTAPPRTPAAFDIRANNALSPPQRLHRRLPKPLPPSSRPISPPIPTCTPSRLSFTQPQSNETLMSKRTSIIRNRNSLTFEQLQRPASTGPLISDIPPQPLRQRSQSFAYPPASRAQSPIYPSISGSRPESRAHSPIYPPPPGGALSRATSPIYPSASSRAHSPLYPMPPPARAQTPIYPSRPYSPLYPPNRGPSPQLYPPAGRAQSSLYQQQQPASPLSPRSPPRSSSTSTLRSHLPLSDDVPLALRQQQLLAQSRLHSPSPTNKLIPPRRNSSTPNFFPHRQQKKPPQRLRHSTHRRAPTSHPVIPEHHEAPDPSPPIISTSTPTLPTTITEGNNIQRAMTPVGVGPIPTQTSSLPSDEEKKERERERKEKEKEKRDDERAMRMRDEGMQELHREHLRRLQRRAKAV
ncbi:hypothetical protein EX30DRAFT_343715 [Ascodesmis nigricans]|uniref:TM7S3/TM198-like domain-containing protein n=1 Tax=Ascodesmis nigricans TaxID=341454 RepID=A0A4S2ML80_9PEZI|nr:hypothetical protein EX30DRAFT_343715 [Ascodesmis nigricans]